MEKDIVERLDSMSGLSDRDSDTRNDAVLYINILRQKSAQQSVQRIAFGGGRLARLGKFLVGLGYWLAKYGNR